jgi:hypothetical protein
MYGHRHCPQQQPFGLKELGEASNGGRVMDGQGCKVSKNSDDVDGFDELPGEKVKSRIHKVRKNQRKGGGTQRWMGLMIDDLERIQMLAPAQSCDSNFSAD